jgi:hypothetical protein
VPDVPACLLAERLGFSFVEWEGMTFSDGEAALSAWMDRNAFVCWCEAAEQWLVEEELTRTVDLPLNLDQNRHHAFHAELSRLQAEQKAKARELPTLPR